MAYRNQEGEGWGGVVDFLSLLAEPALVSLVGELVEAAVFATQEHSAKGGALKELSVLSILKSRQNITHQNV